jgi:hypothetical protein
MPYLFCFLKPDKRSPAVNQYRAVEVCKKLGCGYLDLSQVEPGCTCEPSVEYFLAFKDGNKKLKEEVNRKYDEAHQDENPVSDLEDGNGSPGVGVS